MTTVCVICGAIIESGITCSRDQCLNEFKSRREIALARMRAIKAMKKERNGGRTREEIVSSILRAAARVILDSKIPVYVSRTDLDAKICEIDPSLNAITERYRKSQITLNVGDLNYQMHTHSGNGRVTFMMSGDKGEVRRKLEQIARPQGMMM